MLRSFVPACLINPHLVNNTRLSPSDYRTAAYLCQPFVKPWLYEVWYAYTRYSPTGSSRTPSHDQWTYSTEPRGSACERASDRWGVWMEWSALRLPHVVSVGGET
jgi:hypothetical protein